MTLLLLDGSLSDPRAGLPTDMPEPDLVVWNKADLFDHERGYVREGLSISLKTGEGLFELLEMLQQKVQHKLEMSSAAPPLTRPRHRHALREAFTHLQHGLAAPQAQPELLAEDLRLAMRAIGRITGVVDVEELLDFVFRDFCIGK
jgi:tRNA modification GTPase